MKLIITTKMHEHSIPQHTIHVVREDGQEVDISGVVTRIRMEYPAGEVGMVMLDVPSMMVEHRTEYVK